MRMVGTVATAAGRVGGAALEGATALLSRVRPAEKPLHPRGTVRTGRLHRTGNQGEPTGVSWLDEPGDDEVLVRLSAAIGLPPGWPDVQGLALRVDLGDSLADILLATTGLGRVSRFLLTVTRWPQGRPLTTLLPYRTPGGPLLLAARAVPGRRYALMHARGTGRWVPFGELELGERIDARPSFDPIENPLPGTGTYPWVRALRAPSYRRARRDRDAPDPDGRRREGQ
jgi:hypothetical protein